MKKELFPVSRGPCSMVGPGIVHHELSILLVVETTWRTNQIFQAGPKAVVL